MTQNSVTVFKIGIPSLVIEGIIIIVIDNRNDLLVRRKNVSGALNDFRQFSGNAQLFQNGSQLEHLSVFSFSSDCLDRKAVGRNFVLPQPQSRQSDASRTGILRPGQALVERVQQGRVACPAGAKHAKDKPDDWLQRDAV